ncbi:MAG: hypothetical protein WBD51_23170, partial [Burkholderiaceae bacterium]
MNNDPIRPSDETTFASRWIEHTIRDVIRQFRWSFVPPLMVYLAAGVSGLTGIVGTFFIKEYLGLSAGYLAGLTFWAGLPWALKMPLGHLVDIWWRHKSWLVYFGASLIAFGLLIMYGLIAHTAAMRAMMPIETWFVVSTLLSPTGYVIQDVVADAMTVEAVPTVDENAQPFSEEHIKQAHTTMQTFGRFAIIGGSLLVAALNIGMFAGVELMAQTERASTYAQIYLIALVVPVISVFGVILGSAQTRRRMKGLIQRGYDRAEIRSMLYGTETETRPNWWIFGGSIVFVLFTVGVGASQFLYAQEIVFVGAMGIVIFLMARLFTELPLDARRQLIGTAVIIFVFRAIPSPGAGMTWFEIDELKFDQQFLAVLSLITSALTLVGIVLLRPLMATRSIAYVVTLLTIAFGILSLPNIGLYYGIHHWTESWSNGFIDARAIA